MTINFIASMGTALKTAPFAFAFAFAFVFVFVLVLVSLLTREVWRWPKRTRVLPCLGVYVS
jgi:hypothetical protein